MINDYAGVQNNLKSHSSPEYGDASIQSDITKFTKVSAKDLLENKTSAFEVKETLAQLNTLNLNTMLAAAM